MQTEAQKRSKYRRGNLPSFTREDVQMARQHGFIQDDEGNTWKYVKSQAGKDELYCPTLHLSIPLYDKERVPIDPLRRFK